MFLLYTSQVDPPGPLSWDLEIYEAISIHKNAKSAMWSRREWVCMLAMWERKFSWTSLAWKCIGLQKVQVSGIDHCFAELGKNYQVSLSVSLGSVLTGSRPQGNQA